MAAKKCGFSHVEPDPLSPFGGVSSSRDANRAYTIPARMGSAEPSARPELHTDKVVSTPMSTLSIVADEPRYVLTALGREAISGWFPCRHAIERDAEVLICTACGKIWELPRWYPRGDGNSKRA